MRMRQKRERLFSAPQAHLVPMLLTPHLSSPTPLHAPPTTLAPLLYKRSLSLSLPAFVCSPPTSVSSRSLSDSSIPHFTLTLYLFLHISSVSPLLLPPACLFCPAPVARRSIDLIVAPVCNPPTVWCELLCWYVGTPHNGVRPCVVVCTGTAPWCCGVLRVLPPMVPWCVGAVCRPMLVVVVCRCAVSCGRHMILNAGFREICGGSGTLKEGR
jgi:hypothetical protein